MALARHFRPPVRLPEHVAVNVLVVQKVNNQLIPRTIREYLTKSYDDVGMKCERDAFDTLFDHAPDKLQVVKKVETFILYNSVYISHFLTIIHKFTLCKTICLVPDLHSFLWS